MNKKIKLTILSVLALVGLFANVNTTFAGRAPVVTCNSATIYGSVWPNGATVDAWLEWGNNRNTVQNGGGTRIGFRTVNYDTEISAYLSGLTENTTYYYRMAIQDGPDYVPASTESFTTLTCTPTVLKPTIRLTANNTNINYGGSTILNWTTTNNPTSCYASGDWYGNKNISGGSEPTGNLYSNKTYSITCSNSAGSDTDFVTVFVGAEATKTYTVNTNAGQGGYISPASRTVNSGSSTTFTITPNQGYTIGSVYGLGCNIFPTGNNEYATGAIISNCTVYATFNLIQSQNPTVFLTVDGKKNTTINSGQSATLSWNTNSATSYCSANWMYNSATTGSQVVSPTSSTTYNITCYGASGTTPATDSVTVTITSLPEPEGELTGNSSCIIPLNESECWTNIRWQVRNPKGISTVTSSYPNFNTEVGRGNDNNEQVSIPFPSRMFYLYNNNKLLDTKNILSSCTVNTQWNYTNKRCESNIVVIPQNATGTLNVFPSSCIISAGQSTCTSSATWNTQNANDPKLADRNTGNVLSTSANSPSRFTVWATYPQTIYDLKNGFNTLDTKIVTASCTSGTSWDNYKCATTVNPPQPQVPTVNLTADQTSVNYNNGTYLRWTSQNATSCTASGGIGNWSGTKNIQDFFYTGPLTSTTTYYMSCSNSTGQSQNSSVTVYVNNNNNNQTPSVNTNSTSSVGINYATLNGYVNSNGGSNVNAWFEWGANSYYGNQTNQISYGSTSGTSYSYNLSGLAQNTTYYYRAVAQNTNGQIVYGNQMSFTTSGGNNYDCTYYGTCYVNQQPLVTTYSASNIGNNLATLNAYIDSRNSSATRWFEYGTNYNSLYSSTNRSGMGSYSGNFSESIYNLAPNTTYYFRAAAQGNNGSIVYGNVLNFNTGTGNIYNACVNGICTPTAVTNIATNIGSTSARLNGVAIVNNAVYTTGYFEYGTTQNLGSTTQNKNTGSTQSSPFYDSLFNLASNTTYYYRAVVANQYGTARGDILSFRTGNYITYTDTTNTNTNTTNTNTTRTIYRNTTVVSNTNDTVGTSRPSLIFLSISRNGEVIRKGSLVEYVVNYKNVSVKNLRDLVLQVYIPKELEFVEASRGTFSTENNTVVANIGSLNSQEEGSTRITVRVTTDTEIGKIIVVTANLAYTIVDTNIQEEVFAYTKNSVETENVVIQQGALAFLFGGSFFPTTLLGWLLLILLIVLLILAVRKAYYNRGVMVVSGNSKTEHH